MEELNEEREITALTTDTVVTHDVSEEFSLPDYVPEIRRLLNVRAQALPESKYISDQGENSRLEIGGTVTYLLVYTDDEGKLCSLPLTSSYEAEATLMSHPSTVFIDTVVDSVSPRVNAPRKITLKSRLKSRIMALEQKNVGERIQNKSSADELFVERQTERVSVMSIKPISMTDIKISDKLELTNIADPRPIWCDAIISVSDTKAQNNTVSVRGEALVKCICDTGSDIVTVTKKVPLAEEIEAEGASLGDMARVMARCVSLTITREQSQNEGELFFELECELEGELARNTEQSVVTDCYSTKFETEEQYKELSLYTLSRAQNTSFTINESIKRKSKDMARVLDVICDPVYEKTETKNGKSICIGHVNITLIGKTDPNESGEWEYLSESYELPFKYAYDTEKARGEIIARCDLMMGSADVYLDGDKISCKIELYPAYEIIERTKMKALDTSLIKKDKEIKKDVACVRVYFPKEGDTLWEIAKKYHTTVNSIKENNDIATETIESIKNLII